MKSKELKEAKKVCYETMHMMQANARAGMSLKNNFKLAKIHIRSSYSSEIAQEFMFQIAGMWLKLTNSYAVTPRQLLQLLNIK